MQGIPALLLMLAVIYRSIQRSTFQGRLNNLHMRKWRKVLNSTVLQLFPCSY